jgi:hypothetical protein
MGARVNNSTSARASSRLRASTDIVRADWRTAFALVVRAPLLGSAMLFGGRVAATAQG